MIQNALKRPINTIIEIDICFNAQTVTFSRLCKYQVHTYLYLKLIQILSGKNFKTKNW